jgi:hypothetical protein
MASFTIHSLGPTQPEASDQDWLWQGYLAPGQLTLLTSLWKSGKTTLLSVLMSRMKAGGVLLGQPVRPARALVISEENVDLWRMRHARLSLGEHVQVICQPFLGKASDGDWRRLLDHCAGVLGPDGGRLLVVDTIATLMPAGVETNADCMVRALAPLRRLGDQGIATWLMHHPHKGKARVGAWSRGSGSLPASVDITLEMHACCPDDLTDRRRLLLGWSRHTETPRRQIIEWTADGADYLVLPDTIDVTFDRAWSTIRRILTGFKDPQSAAAILRKWPPDSPPPSRASLHRWLAHAVERQLLACEASDRKNAPYQYWLAGTEETSGETG